MKPLKTISLLIVTITVSSLFSFNCTSKDSNKVDSTKEDTLWNEKVQNVFFDTPFGASKQEVCYNFEKLGVSISPLFSNDSCLVFHSLPDCVIKFAGLEFTQVDALFNKNNKLFAIGFIKTYEYREDALERYKYLEKVLSQKYKLSEYMPDDSTFIAMKRAYGKNACRASVSCCTYEALVGGEIRYSTRLWYTDDNIEKEEVNLDEVNLDEL